MYYRQIRPCAPREKYVEFYWILEARAHAGYDFKVIIK
jgi:hypothetical protein